MVLKKIGKKIEHFFTYKKKDHTESKVAKRIGNAITLDTFGRDNFIGNEPEKIHWGRIPNIKLRLLHLLYGILQLLGAILMFVFVEDDDTWPWYSNFPITTDRNDSETNFMRPTPDQEARIAIGYYAATALFFSALYHLLLVIPGFWGLYCFWFRRRQNFYRWMEYLIVMPFLVLLTAQLVGITDIHLLFAIFGLTVSSVCFVALHEKMNWKYFAKKRRMKCWLPFVMAAIPWLFYMSIIWCYFWRAVHERDPPTYVWAIFFVLFIIQTLYYIVLFLQWSELGFFRKTYVIGELLFMLLTFILTQSIAWIFLGGSGSRA